MSKRRYPPWLNRPADIEPEKPGDAVTLRVADAIYMRHVSEGDPISDEQAYADAKRAMDAVAIRIAAVKHQED